MRKKLALVAMGAAAALTLAGCAQGDSDSASTDSGQSSEAPTGDIRVWLVGDDTPDNAREYLKETFEENHPGSTLTIEQQEWGGLVEKYTAALSGSDSPDVVEVGNTQASAFTSSGAFLDISDDYDDLGGDDLNQGFVEAGTYDGKFYAAPYYAGSRIVFYNTDIAGEDVPDTLEDYVNQGIELRKEKGDDFSGIYAPGKDWYNALPYLWEYGGHIAEQQDDGSWKAGFSEGIEGLKLRQKVFEEATAAAPDADETKSYVPFCDEKIGYLSAPSWWSSFVSDGDGEKFKGCPDLAENLHVFALPGKEAGTAANVFAGGSNIAVSAKSAHPELAYDALKLLVSPEYQKLLAENGMIPGLTTASDSLPDDEVTQASAAAANNARLTPAAPKWADVEADGAIKQALVKIAQGGDVEAIAKDLDAKIESILNG